MAEKHKNQPLGYDKERRQWRLATCCPDCGKPGSTLCFEHEQDYEDYKDNEFLCTEHWYEHEIKKIREGNSDFDGVAECVLDDVMNKHFPNQRELGGEEWDRAFEKAEKMRDEKLKTMPFEDLKAILEEEVSSFDYDPDDFPWTHCNTEG